MKRLWMVLVAGALVVALTVPALAWEFNLTGQYDYRLRYFSRMGDVDMFGIAGIQNVPGFVTPLNYVSPASPRDAGFQTQPAPGSGTGIPLVDFKLGNQLVGFAGPNWYGSGQINPHNQPGVSPINGILSSLLPFPNNSPLGSDAAAYGTLITRGGFSATESDGIYPDHRLTLTPEFRVNGAIRVHGVYNIGGIRNRYNMTATGIGVPPFERYGAINAMSFSSQDTIGIGSWEQVRATVQLPWGILSYGMKDFPFGVGLFTTSELRGSAFVMVVPYGPFRFIPAFWQGYSTVNGVEAGWSFRSDASNKAVWFGGLLMTYDNGPLSTGGGWIGRNTHYNADVLTPSGLFGRQGGGDGFLNIWAWYLKYFNGRFFANAEYQFATNDTYPIGRASATFTPTTYNEYYHLFSEVGAVCGPTKLSFIWAQASGPVLNNESSRFVSNGSGTFPGGNGLNPKQYTPWGIDPVVMDPYQYLMFGVYAGGNQTFTGLFLNDQGKGLMADAYCFAGRLDYAVASNLNVWGTYLWAHRLETAGNVMGQYYSDGRDTATVLFNSSTGNPIAPINTGAGATSRAAFRGNIGANTAMDLPVPDGYLGWEANLGVNWKLLEGMTWNTRYAYWQPGDWFRFAYQALGPAPGRRDCAYIGNRSAIQALETSFTIDF